MPDSCHGADPPADLSREAVVAQFEFLRVLCGPSSRPWRLKSFDSHKNKTLKPQSSQRKTAKYAKKSS